MRTMEQILADFDDPINATDPVNEVDSVPDSVRNKLALEVALDMREVLVEIKDSIAECKEELVEIKNNTA